MLTIAPKETVARLCKVRSALLDAHAELNELLPADHLADPDATRAPWANATNRADDALSAVGALIDHLS